MRFRHVARSITGTSLLAAAMIAGSTQTANAATTAPPTAAAAPSAVVAAPPGGGQYICAADGAVNGYYWKTTPAYRFVGSGQRVYGQSGGTLSISRGTTKTITGSITGTTSVDAGVVFAKASASVGVTIGGSYAVTVKSAYTWTVPRNQANGWIELGSAGYRIDWQKGQFVGSCTYRVQGSGVVTGVTKNAAFAHS